MKEHFECFDLRSGLRGRNLESGNVILKHVQEDVSSRAGKG